MNYDTEAWVKLYRRESTDDRCLPVVNRALRDFLLRFAKSRDDATILRKTANPAEDLARAIGAHSTETELITGYIRSMLEDGYLTHENGRLWITNFVAAQQARTQGAQRQKAYREKHKPATRDVMGDVTSDVMGDVTGDVTSDANSDAVTGDVTGDARITLQKRREEERREDPDQIQQQPLSGSDRSGARRPVAAAAAVVENPNLIPCPRDLTLSTDQIATLEVSGVAREAIPPLTAAFVAKYIDDQNDHRTLKVWRRCLVSAVSGAWNDPRRRPKAPGLVAHHEQLKTSQRVVSGATRAIMGNLLRDLR